MDPLELLKHAGEFCVWPRADMKTPKPGSPRMERKQQQPRGATVQGLRYKELKYLGICTRCRTASARDGKAHCAPCASYVADWMREKKRQRKAGVDSSAS